MIARGLLLTLLVALAPVALPQEARLASDFEIAQMEKQLAETRGFEAHLAARLNLGDVRAARGETSQSREEYRSALALASDERRRARLDSALTRYAHATSYAALAHAKLGESAEAFVLLEEALRYTSDDAETWNLYASAMRLLDRDEAAISAARNAVAIAAKSGDALDLAVYQHALATALIDGNEPAEAASILENVAASLASDRFRELREDVARSESFEVHSATRGDVAAFVALQNRVLLRLGSLYESRGDTDAARDAYQRALATRTDDAVALAALARLARDEDERERMYAAAFDANPFAAALVREYRRHVRAARPVVGCESDCSTGARVRLAIVQLERRDLRDARSTLDPLLRDFPSNETLRALRQEAEGSASVTLPATNEPSADELQALLDAYEKLTSEQKRAIDAAQYSNEVRFGGSTFVRGTIHDIAFRFGTEARFAGEFDVAQPLRLTYRILGVTRDRGRSALLLEPLRLEVIR